MGRAAVRRSRERGLLRLRKDLGVFANLRPALCFDALKDASTLKPEIVVRPRHPDRARADRRGLFRRAQGNHDPARRPEARRRYQVYTTSEIERIAASPSSWRGCAATRCLGAKNPM